MLEMFFYIMIIGITGTLGAGKGTVVEFLKEKGFEHYCATSFISEEIVRRGLVVNRDNMVFIANDLRAKFGSGYIIKQLYKRAEQKGGDAVIESLRCPGEIEVLKDKGCFVLWAVDADVETRYARIVARGGVKDSVSFQDFVSGEQREMSSNDHNKQNIGVCIEMADRCFRNDWTKAELKRKILKELERNAQKLENFIRPSWDEYFIEIMDTVSKRVTCDRARAGGGGCVIVKDRHILVTGYVGSPPGCGHCDEIGHQFKGMVHEDGKITNHCVRTTHAEQNAICQAAKLGIPLEGSTLYCFMSPCYTCAKLIITSGIKRVIASKDYHASKDSKDLFREAGVKFELLNDEVQQYDKM